MLLLFCTNPTNTHTISGLLFESSTIVCLFYFLYFNYCLHQTKHYDTNLCSRFKTEKVDFLNFHLCQYTNSVVKNNKRMKRKLDFFSE